MVDVEFSPRTPLPIARYRPADQIATLGAHAPRPRLRRSTAPMTSGTSGLKVGMHLHPERGVDAVLAEARAADEQGYDSVWLADHLMREPEDPDGGLDSLTLMTAIAVQTRNVRLA